MLLAFWMSSADSSQPAGTFSDVHATGGPGFVGERSCSTPSGPGWFWARVSTMKAWLGGTSSPLPAMPSGPSVISGSSARRGTNTVPPLLTVWSTPWSKNWPKNVNSELYGGERPTSVVTFGMNSVLCDGTQPSGVPSGSPALGSIVQWKFPGLPWVRTGNSAAAMAAGLVDV